MRFHAKGRGGWWVLSVSLLSIVGFAASNSELRLVDAVEGKDTATVRSLLRQHANVNAPQADGATALAWAAHWDDVETADLLIRAGANVNAANDYGVTPLSLACSNRNSEMVEKLLKAGANANAAQWNGETALMTCARTGTLDAVKSLVAHGADVNAKETGQGQTALMWTLAEKHTDVARALVEHGADVRARSKSGFTPLMFTAQQGDLDAARMLLAAGVNVNDASPQDGSALVAASASGHQEFAIFLLENGADPNAADASGITALHYALQKGMTVVSGVNVDPYVSHLFRPNMVELVKALLAHGANPNARLKQAPPHLMLLYKPRLRLPGATPLFLAAATGDVNVMRMLVASGADPLLGTTANTTPLMAAAGLGQQRDRTAEEEKNALEAVKLAVELGVDVNGAGERGMTALGGAAMTGANSIIQFLADSGAQINQRDRCGQTALSIAEGDPAELVDRSDRYRVHKNTATLLRKLGADPTPPAEPVSQCQHTRHNASKDTERGEWMGLPPL